MTESKLVPGGTLTLLRDASKTYGKGNNQQDVFSGLSVEIFKGSRLAVMGPNACGKSTFIRLLAGLEHLDTGFTELILTPSQRAGCVLQDYRLQLLPWASVERNILLPLGERPTEERCAGTMMAVKRLLEATGYQIDMRLPIKTLSGGQQQAIVVARSLACGTDVYLWDEPTNAIDLLKRRRFHIEIDAQWRRSTATVVISTHDIEEALSLSNRVMIFNVGMKLIEDVPIHRPDGTDLKTFLTSANAADARERLRLALYGEAKR